MDVVAVTGRGVLTDLEGKLDILTAEYMCKFSVDVGQWQAVASRRVPGDTRAMLVQIPVKFEALDEEDSLNAAAFRVAVHGDTVLGGTADGAQHVAQLMMIFV